MLMDNVLWEVFDAVLAPFRLALFAVLWPLVLVFGAVMLWGGATAGTER